MKPKSIHRIGYLVNKGYLTAAPKAHIPKAEVPAQHAPTPKRKRNEHK
jgi:hypothetical protein